MTQHQFTHDQDKKSSARRKRVAATAAPHPLLQLQKTAGNQAVQHLIAQRQAAAGGGDSAMDQQINQAVTQSLNAPVTQVDLMRYQAKLSDYFMGDRAVSHNQINSLGGVITLNRQELQRGLQSKDNEIALRLGSGPIHFKERHNNFPR